MRKIFILLFYIFILSNYAIFSQTSNFMEEELKWQNNELELPFTDVIFPSEKSKNSRNQTEITIRSNVSDAKVYINGNYKGTTPLSIVGLVPGKYKVRLKKSGYESAKAFVNVTESTSSTFYISMHKPFGLLQMANLDSNCLLYVDGNLKTNREIKLEEGFHNIRIRKFGFKDISKSVYIPAKMIKRIFVTFEEAPFEITSIQAEKTLFNPTYSGKLGICKITAEVTAPETGTLCIYNEVKEIVASQAFNKFSTWEQTFFWNGKDSSGKLLPEGNYTAVFSSKDLSKSVDIKISYSLKYHLNETTIAGTGVANIPTAQRMPNSILIISLASAPMFSLQNNFFTNQNRLGLCIVSSPSLELSGTIGLENGPENLAVSFSAAVKGATAIPFSEKSNFCLGVSLRYAGIFEEEKTYISSNSDNGLGLAVLSGFQTQKTFSGFTSQFIFNSNKTDSVFENIFFKNSLVFTFMPKTSYSMNIFASLNSKLKPNVNWLKTLESGIETSFLNSKMSLKTTLGFDILYYIEENILNLGGHISVAYLF